MTGRELAERVRGSRDSLVESALAGIYVADPQAWERYGEAGRNSCKKDLGYHVDYLVEALAFGDPEIFTRYAEWMSGLFENLGLGGARGAARALAYLEAPLENVLGPEASAEPRALLRAGMEAALAAGGEDRAGLSPAGPLAAEARRFLDLLLSGARAEATELVLGLAREGTPLKTIYVGLFQPCLYEIGRLWMEGRISVAQEHYFTAATQSVMSRLYPYLFAGPKNGKRLVASGVASELHEVGIRMVADLFELEGWDTYYIGANAPPSAVVAAVEERGAELLCLSVTMSFHLSALEATIAAARARFPRERLKILVGGRPFRESPGLWEKTGADGYAPDAVQALKIAADLVGLGERT